jgi:prophage regulatory protein
LLNKSSKQDYVADRGQTGIHLQTDQALQAAIQALADAMREMVKEAVREALLRQAASTGGSRGSVELEQESFPREALIRLPVVKQLTGYSTTTIYEQMAEGQFPCAVHLGPRAVAWHAGEVLDWIAARPRVDSGYSGNQDAMKSDV